MRQTCRLFFRGIRRFVAASTAGTIFMGGLLAALLMWPAARASSPSAEPVPRGGDTLHIRLDTIDTLATFDAPTMLRRDPRGRLYVLEPSRHQLHVIAPDRSTQHTIGGSGSRAGQFRRPAGFDPTNGQMLLIADTGNGRLQRLDADGRPLEVLPVSYREEPIASVYRPSQGESVPTGSGRPRAVQSMSSSGLVVLESDASALWYLDRERTVLQRITPPDVPHASWRPHAILRTPTGAIWTLDADRPQVLITDALGSIIAAPTLAPDSTAAFVDGFATGNAVGLVQPRGLTLFDEMTYAPRRHWRWPHGAASLHSATATRDSLYVLAGPHLLATPRP